MKPRAIATRAALMLLCSVVTAIPARATEEFAIPVEASTEWHPELESPLLVDAGSPLTLMQWSYGGGADLSQSLHGPIETDRPYFTKTASVVGLTNWQLETGATYGRDSNRGRNLVSFPEALLRIGAFAEWFEFRVGWNWIDANYQTSRRAYDATYPYVGMKIALAPQDQMLPQTAILIDADLPTQEFSPELSTSNLQPGLNILYHWDLNNGFEMGGATEFRRIADNRTPFLMFAQSWMVERSITDALTGFGEWYMVSPDTPRAHVEHYLDTGLLYTLTENVQLDAIVGAGLSNAAFDYFVGSGVSIRW
jgi:hypothetical protein